MKKKFLVLLFALLSYVPVHGYADQPASEKSVRELMVLMGSGNLGVQTMQAMLPTLKRLVPQAPEAFWVEFMKEVNPEDLVNLVVPLYQKHLTEEDVQATLAFYRSPAGTRLVQALPAIMQESIPVGQKWGRTMALRAIQAAQTAKSKPPAP